MHQPLTREVLIGNLRTTAPDALELVSCPVAQVSTRCPGTLMSLGFPHAPLEYFLSKASSSLAVALSICSPTEVALDYHTGWRRQPKAHPAQQYEAMLWLLLLYVSTCRPSKTDLGSASEIDVFVKQLQTGL